VKWESKKDILTKESETSLSFLKITRSLIYEDSLVGMSEFESGSEDHTSFSIFFQCRGSVRSRKINCTQVLLDSILMSTMSPFFSRVPRNPFTPTQLIIKILDKNPWCRSVFVWVLVFVWV